MGKYTTKSGNYLLRSRHSMSLRRVMVLATEGRVRMGGHGIPIIVDWSGKWVGSCQWEMKQLLRRGLLEKVEYLDQKAPVTFRTTREGRLCAFGAGVVAGKLSTPILLAEIDSRRIH